MSAGTSPFSLSQSFVAFRGFRRNRADRRHAPAQRPHGLVGHGDDPVLSEGCEPSYQDRTPGHAIGETVSSQRDPTARAV